MTIDKEILIYTNQPFKKYRWIGIFSAVQIGFVVLSLIVMPTPRILEERRQALVNKVVKKNKKQSDDSDAPDVIKQLEEFEINPDYDPATFWQRIKRLKYNELFSIKNVKENISERPYLSLGLLGGSILISTAFYTYARRMAHMITLLPNDRVRFSSFSPFAIGKPPSIELPLRDVSCVQGRKSQNNYSILKFRGYTGFHLIHKSEGIFLEPKLYDQHLGYERSWARKT